MAEPLQPEELLPVLNLKLPSSPSPNNLTGTIEKLLRYTPSTWHPGFLNKLYAGADPVGVVAELVLAAMNANTVIWKVSPVITAMEKILCRELGILMGIEQVYLSIPDIIGRRNSLSRRLSFKSSLCGSS